MSVQEFDKNFGLKASILEEKFRFIARIENGIFSYIYNLYKTKESREKLFRSVCYQLGEDASILIKIESILFTEIPNLQTLSKGNFIKTLRTVVALHSALADVPSTQKYISYLIKDILSKSALDLGIKWSDGIFYPSGDKLLDEALIEDSLQILNDFPNEKKDLKNALDNYYSKSLYGVVENCYLCAEGLFRNLLGNKKTLIDNKSDIIQILQFSPYWNKILANYLSYANDYRRHAGENRHDLKPNEVEAFLYLSCLIIKASIRAYKEKI